MAELNKCTCGWTGLDMDSHASWCALFVNPPLPKPAAIDADTLFGLRRYLNDVLEAGTVNEQVVARTALRMIATPPADGVKVLDRQTGGS